MTVEISAHAITEIRRRKLSKRLIEQVVRDPQQTIPARNGLICRQSIIQESSGGKDYLLRVIVNPAQQPNVIVTAYKTSKIEKHWGLSHES